jgi:hypothetical protein
MVPRKVGKSFLMFLTAKVGICRCQDKPSRLSDSSVSTRRIEWGHALRTAEWLVAQHKVKDNTPRQGYSPITSILVRYLKFLIRTSPDP